MERATAIVDYAFPAMMAEKALKDAHLFMLARMYDEAAEQTLTALAETKLMLNAINDMKERAK
jgi:hypothetical protein